MHSVGIIGSAGRVPVESFYVMRFEVEEYWLWSRPSGDMIPKRGLNVNDLEGQFVYRYSAQRVTKQMMSGGSCGSSTACIWVLVVVTLQYRATFQPHL